MTYRKAGWIIIVSVVTVFFAVLIRDTDKRIEGLDVEFPEAVEPDLAGELPEESLSVAQGEDEPMVARSLFVEPSGRYEKSTVLDRVGPYVEGENTVVRFMVSGPDDRIERILVEERYIEDPDTGEMLLRSESAMVGDELMIDADPGKIDEARFDQFVASRNLQVVKESRLSHYLSLKKSGATIRDFDELFRALRETFPDTMVSEDHLYYINADPNDYNAPLMWNLDQIGVSNAWRFNTGGEDVIVGVVDTGVLLDHPDLEANIWQNPLETPGNGVDDDGNGFVDDTVGWDFYDDDSSPNDSHGHGTHISGTIGAVGNNSVGTVGVNWNVKIIPLRVGTQDSLSSSAISEGLRYLRSIKERGENVIASNNSYGSPNRNFVAEQEVRNHRNEGILFVAASGNDGDNLDLSGNAQYPAQINSSNVIAVSNTNQKDELTANSNYGGSSVHIAAPGTEIYSTHVSGNQYAILSGTSMSTPLVVGTAALLKSYRPTMSADAIKARILDTVDVVPALSGKVITGGRLNVANALQPDLKGFEVSVSNHPGAIVFLPEANLQTTFEIETADDAVVTASLVEPNSGATIVTLEDGKSFSASFSEEGSYMIRFVADLLGVDKRIDRLVVVGSPSDVTNNLKHEWSFEEEGADFADTAGNANATIENVTRVSSPMGHAADFAGANSRAIFQSSFYPRVTISGFVRNENLLSSDHPRITQGPNYYMYFSTNNVSDGNSETLKFLSVRSGGLGVWNANPGTAVANQWMHVMASYDTRDTANVPDMYINGVKQRVRAQSFPEGTQIEDAGTSYLGDREDGNRAWDGQFDEVRIYDAPLTEYNSMVLSSRYLHSLWRSPELSGVEESVVGKVESFASILNYEGVDNLVKEWKVTGPSELSYVIESQSDSEIEIAFLAKGSFVIEQEIVAPESSYLLRKEVEVAGKVNSGVFVSEVGEDGNVWLEVGPDLESGSITYFSPSVSQRLIREPISINEAGAFETGASSSLRVSGQVDGPIFGHIDELNIDFLSDSVLPVSGGSEFEGDFKGGGVNVADEYFDLVIFETGSALLFRDGETVDVAQGSVQSSGDFQLISSSGAIYDGTVELENGQVTGRVSGEEDFDFFLYNGQNQESAKFVNISTRGYSADGEGVLIGGFVVEGIPRKMMVRAIGPTLAEHNVSNVLSQPQLSIFKGGTIVASGGVWGEQANASEIESFANTVGAFEVAADSQDAAFLGEFQQGIYTAIVSGMGGGSGNVLLEVYDSREEMGYSLANVSTRGRIDGNTNVMIAGFVIGGTEPKKTLVRVVGPSLSGHVDDPLDDPMLTVIRGESIVAINDDWGESMDGNSDDRVERILEASQTAGAFPMVEGSKDAAAVLWLEPGIYTLIASGVEDSSGLALVEVYELR